MKSQSKVLGIDHKALDSKLGTLSHRPWSKELHQGRPLHDTKESFLDSSLGPGLVTQGVEQDLGSF